MQKHQHTEREEAFIQLIEAFQARVQLAIKLFEEHRGISDVMNWRKSGLSRTGFITADGMYKYAFHGVGCWAETPDGEIDWDFSNSGRSDGFDLWRLEKFVESSPGTYPHFEIDSTLKQAFDYAVSNKRIEKSPVDPVAHLYYLS